MRIRDLSETIETPRWDIALEALFNEEVASCRKIDVEAIMALSEKYSIRFEDLIVTLFELTFFEQWRYCEQDGKPGSLTHHDLDSLYKKGRIESSSATHLTGYWEPVG